MRAVLLFTLIAAMAAHAREIRAPESGTVAVAFVVTEGANVIDFAGPWEVFQDTARPGTDAPAFRLYTVSDSTRPIRLTGGLRLVPDFSFADAPAPAVVVVGANGHSDAMIAWLRRIGASERTEVLMSVCTGAFKLGDAGLLDGKPATTHHDFFDAFAQRFPQVQLERGPRYVQSAPHVFTAGGLTSGIDLALHIVGRYYGEPAAQATARYMEYRRSGG